MPVCFRIVLFDILVDGPLYDFDSALSKAGSIQQSVVAANRVVAWTHIQVVRHRATGRDSWEEALEWLIDFATKFFPDL